jgi:hypothetical protein
MRGLGRPVKIRIECCCAMVMLRCPDRRGFDDAPGARGKEQVTVKAVNPNYRTR